MSVKQSNAPNHAQPHAEPDVKQQAESLLLVQKIADIEAALTPPR
jgi:hypothetical protein